MYALLISYIDPLSGHNQPECSEILKVYTAIFFVVLIYRSYEEQFPPTQEVMNIVNTYLSEKETLDHLLPSFIVIGPFRVRIEHIRHNLSVKHKAVATAVLDLLAKTLHSQVLKVSYLVQWIICLCLVLSFCF